ncbi:hypothetical protein [Glycomyces xiaoerkulensis]|uniref:hypothetical protein n=1 Tax=Glycomyces xiaoerkulensis TaxID=2038139 RepID=UPI000C2657C4|nr:hypothetical protein [Glycomyces xiaoerkulensis]
MSDQQFEPEEYDGLDAAVASGGTPAFGDVDTERNDLTTATSGAETLPDNVDVLPAQWRKPCSNPECGNPLYHPAEESWQQLVSAVPVRDQLYRLKPRAHDMAYPTEADFRAAVAAVRPEYADEHSLERLRAGWTEEVAGKLADWPERIKSELSDLGEGWSGSDFEAFEQVCTETRGLVDDIVEDIDGTVAQLQELQETIYTLQGGDLGEIPFPAARFWIDGEWHSWVSVHVRPAWWHGDCIQHTCQDAEHVLALAGADPELGTEIIDYIDERVEHYVDYYENPANIERDGLDPKGITIEEAKRMAVADAADAYGGVVEQNWQEYDGRQQGVDEDIEQRNADNDSEQQSVRTTSSDKPYPSVADQAYMDLDPPSMEHPTGTASPESTEDPSLEPPESQPPEGDGPPGGSDDDDEPGGLASGGPGGGGVGGGFGGVGGSGPTTGGAPGAAGGGPGPAATGAGAAGMAGTAAGGGAGGAAPRGGMTGMMGGAGGGMRGGQSSDEDHEADVDLTEDKNMWGFVSEDDDPYA